MARTHGTPGELVTLAARKRYRRILVALALVPLSFGFLAGFAAGKSTPLLSVLVLLVTIIAATVGEKPLTRYIDAIQHERLQFLKGARGEQLVGWLLDDLPDSWHVFHSVRLKDRGDIDHIAVGPSGVYVISTKSHRGLFGKSPEGHLLYNDKPTPNVEKTLAEMMSFKDRLAALLGNKDLYLHAVLAVPFGYVDLAGPIRGVHVLHQDNLVDTLEKAPKRLSDQQIAVLVKAIDTLATTSRDLQRAAAKAHFPTRHAKDPLTVTAGRADSRR